MSTTSLLVIAILILATLGYFLAGKRAISTAGGDRRKLHSNFRFITVLMLPCSQRYRPWVFC